MGQCNAVPTCAGILPTVIDSGVRYLRMYMTSCKERSRREGVGSGVGNLSPLFSAGWLRRSCGSTGHWGGA